MHIAAYSNYVEMARVLLTHGATMNAQDENGETPLHHAVHALNQDMAEVLLAHGADPNPEGMGGTPLDVALRKGNASMAELLRRHGAVEKRPRTARGRSRPCR